VMSPLIVYYGDGTQSAITSLSREIFLHAASGRRSSGGVAGPSSSGPEPTSLLTCDFDPACGNDETVAERKLEVRSCRPVRGERFIHLVDISRRTRLGLCGADRGRSRVRAIMGLSSCKTVISG